MLSAAKPNGNRDYHPPLTRRPLGFSRNKSGISPTYNEDIGFVPRDPQSRVITPQAMRAPEFPEGWLL